MPEISSTLLPKVGDGQGVKEAVRKSQRERPVLSKSYVPVAGTARGNIMGRLQTEWCSDHQQPWKPHLTTRKQGSDVISCSVERWPAWFKISWRRRSLVTGRQFGDRPWDHGLLFNWQAFIEWCHLWLAWGGRACASGECYKLEHAISLTFHAQLLRIQLWVENTGK